MHRIARTVHASSYITLERVLRKVVSRLPGPESPAPRHYHRSTTIPNHNALLDQSVARPTPPRF